MKTGWVMRLEDASQNSLSKLLRMSKREAEGYCAQVNECGSAKAELVSVYSEYNPVLRETKEFTGELKEVLKTLSDQHPLLISQEGNRLSIEIDKVT